MVKRLTSVALVCTLLSIFLVIPAKAASVSGSCDLGYGFGSLSTLQNGGGTFKTKSISYPGTSNAALYSTTSSVVYGGLSSLSGFSAPTSFESNLVITFSYYLTSYNYSTFSDGDYSITRYWNDTSGEHSSTDSVESTFWDAPSVPSGTHASKGVTIKATFSATEDNPFTNPRLDWNPALLCGRLSKDTQLNYNITSFRVITTTAPSGELLELENIAALIAQTNSILSAMYGDILAVCNSIYERTGDLLTAQNLTNQYFSAIVPVIEGLKTTTDNIYTLLGQQFSLLISTIQTESDDIQATINAAIDKIIAYLDNAFNSSINPALPGTSQDITTNNDTVHNAESDYQSTAADRFDSISADFSGFDGSILSGVALGGSLFQRLWNVLGDYVILYTFPLTLSICLVVVGRLSRNASRSGGGKKKDGDDS